MRMEQADIEYFEKGGLENERFWARLGGKPEFKGAKVLDVGCGHGRMAVDLTRQGARSVVGVDLNSRLIAFARENLRCNHPDLVGAIQFFDKPLAQLPEGDFDFIVTKDTLEHTSDLPGLMGEMKEKLKKGGRIFAGVGPLYNSPFGDHGGAKIPIPWGHLLFDEKKIVARLNRQRGQPISSLCDLGLNKLSFAEHRRILKESGMRVTRFETNKCSRPVVESLFKFFSSMPFCREYFTLNIYCILEK